MQCLKLTLTTHVTFEIGLATMVHRERGRVKSTIEIDLKFIRADGLSQKKEKGLLTVIVVLTLGSESLLMLISRVILYKLPADEEDNWGDDECDDDEDSNGELSGDGVYMPAIRARQTPCLSLTPHCFYTTTHYMTLHTRCCICVNHLIAHPTAML